MKFEIERYLKAASGPVKRLELLQAMRVIINDLSLTDRKMRQCIEDMVVKDGFCIASSNNGYYIIKTLDEKEATKKYLQEKIEALCIRRNCIERNFKEEKIVNSQILLPL